jgi:hypothetical protein
MVDGNWMAPAARVMTSSGDVAAVGLKVRSREALPSASVSLPASPFMMIEW